MKLAAQKKTLQSVLPAIIVCLLYGCASQGPPENGAFAGPVKSIEGPAADVLEIILEIPVGSVEVIATAESRISATLEMRCDSNNKKCVRLAESVELKRQVFENRLYLSTNKRSKFAFRNSHSDYKIHVPHNVPLRIVMGYGELKVSGLHSDLVIDMNAGAISVDAPRSAVRRVWADANFGDASLLGTDSGNPGKRRLLVGAEADWRQGTGRHDIVVNLTAGDVTVRLTPE